MLIEALSWDSVFFGLNIGVVHAGKFEKALFLKEQHQFDLVYIYEYPDSQRLAVIASVCGDPVDIRVSYVKTVDPLVQHPAGIVPYLDAVPDAQMLSMAWQSGIYSRFYKDPKFAADAYRRLYTEWICRSTDKTRALEVLVYREAGGQELGFVTLEEKQGAAHIGLIAVDERARGRGIGTCLVRAAEYEAHRRNFLNLKVATQAVNREACQLYEKCGFTVEEVIHIYHYWKT